MEIRQLLLNLRATASNRAVSRATGLARNTVRHYRQWAEQQGLLDLKHYPHLPPQDELQQLLDTTLPALTPPQNTSSVAPFREMVRQLRQQGVEVSALFARLRERGYVGSYSSVYRFVRASEGNLHDAHNAVVRVETSPGEEAQVDFGAAGQVYDEAQGRWRKGWVFVMTLSHSRHQYVEFVFDQKTETWLQLHIRALTYFGGVPARVVLDNLKAGMVRASWDDPVVNRAYHELAEYYGFLVRPCRPGTPQHKGKVESGVHYVARNFLAGRERTTLLCGLRQLNADALSWCQEVGRRSHGTTRQQPLELFHTLEQAALRPLPASPYDLAVHKRVKLHRDCHVVFAGAYYSAPCRLVGQTLWLRAGLHSVRLFDEAHQLVATHERAAQPGERHTHHDHLPPQKLPGLLRSPERLREQAAVTGPATMAIIEELLSEPVLDRSRTAGRLLRLGEVHSAARLEAACARALGCGDTAYGTVKRILTQGLESVALPAPPAAPVATTYARAADEVLGGLLEQVSQGGGAWT